MKRFWSEFEEKVGEFEELKEIEKFDGESRKEVVSWKTCGPGNPAL